MAEVGSKALSHCSQDLEYHCPKGNDRQVIHRSQCQQLHIATNGPLTFK